MSFQITEQLVKHDWIKEYTNLLIAKNGLERGAAMQVAQNEYSKLQNSYREWGYLSPEDWLYAG